jgi:hypothetical protein
MISLSELKEVMYMIALAEYIEGIHHMSSKKVSV